jgi:hypothetical protein
VPTARPSQPHCAAGSEPRSVTHEKQQGADAGTLDLVIRYARSQVR